MNGWRFAFVVKGRLPTFNEMEHARGHVRDGNRHNTYADLKKRHQNDVALQIQSAWRGVPAPGLVEVACCWTPHGRSDPDNQASGIKIVLDALVACGVLATDARKVVRRIVHYFPDLHQWDYGDSWAAVLVHDLQDTTP